MFRLEWVNRCWIVTERYEGDIENIEEAVKAGRVVLLVERLEMLGDCGISENDMLQYAPD